MNNVRALVITPDANVRWEMVDAHDLSALKKLIGDGWLEIVPIQPGIMHGYVNEDSKALNLETNYLGTLAVAVLGKRPGAVYDPLRGPLVILGDGEDGEEASAPHEAQQGVLKAFLTQEGVAIAEKDEAELRRLREARHKAEAQA